MGDCRIIIFCHVELLDVQETNNTKSRAGRRLIESYSELLASDTTVRECLSKVHHLLPPKADVVGKIEPQPSTDIWSLLQNNHHAVSIWDCTAFPPHDITEKCCVKGEMTTLHSAGWFPSGTLQVLPFASEPIMASSDAYQDVQYNLHDVVGTSGVQVATTAKTKMMLPSQLLQSAAKRHSSEDQQAEAQQAERKSLQLRREANLEKRKREAERAERLDRRIQQLREKESKTSVQVSKMLIQSRAKGRPNLRHEDRIYLQCLTEGDEEDYKYHYFSLYESVGRALEQLEKLSGINTDGNGRIEFLVRNAAGEYRRLPSTLIFQHAVRSGFLTGQLDSVVLRIKSPDEESTPIVNEDTMDSGEALETGSIGVDGIQSLVESDSLTAQEEESKQSSMPSTQPSPTADQRNDDRECDDPEFLACVAKVKFEAKSPAALKVRQMKMKSKAKGDAKRIRSITDRFFFELITVYARREKCDRATVEGFFFVGRNDTIVRFLRTRGTLPSTWELFALGDKQKLALILSSKDESSSTSWQQAEALNKISCFDQVVWKIDDSDSKG